MEILRNKLKQELTEFCLAGHGLVIGLPGVGKTYLLKGLVKEFQSRGFLTVYLAIDKLGAETESGLKADIEAIAGIQIEGSLLSYLQRLHGSRTTPSILILDAFDAARSETARNLYLSLAFRVISQLGDSWHLIVSVRDYDAKKSQRLLDLFPRNENDVLDSELQVKDVSCRHLLIPRLGVDEVRQALEANARLLVIYERGSAEFKDVLRIPFNLWLAERIADVPNLGAVGSQVQLLGLYWKYRVTDGPTGVDREALLTRMTRIMSDRYTLSVRAEDAYEPNMGKLWHELLSAAVLTEESASSRRVGFTHALLFDYAVSVLLLEDSAEAFVNFIAGDPARSLFLQPSIRYYFARLWHDKRSDFWRIFFSAIVSSTVQVRLLGRIIPTSVICTELKRSTELDPIYQALNEGDEIGEEVALRLLQGLRTQGIEHDKLWSEVVCNFTEQPRRRFAWDITFILQELVERAEKDQDKTVLGACGVASRNLLMWVWKERDEGRDRWIDALGGNRVIALVARTFGTDSDASGQLLEWVLTLTNEPDFPIPYLYWLSDNLKRIWPHDPELTGKVYLTMFGHSETSEKQTNFGTPILPMSSTRRQDFEGCRYILIEAYPAFLKSAPAIAARTIVDCLNHFVMQEHVVRHLKKGVNPKDLIQAFKFRGGQAHYFPDGSYIWDEGHSEDRPMRLGDRLFAFLDDLAKQERFSTIDELLEILRDHAFVAFFWRRLLVVAAKHPKTFSARLLDLCIASPIQQGLEAIHELGVFIENVSSELGDFELEQIEKSILDMPQGSRKWALIQKRNRLLSRLPFERLQTKSGKRIISTLRRTSKIPKNEPLASFRSWSEPYTEEKWLKDQGVDPNKPANRELRDLYAELEKLVAPWRNGKPNAAAIEMVVPAGKALLDRVERAQQADEEIITRSWTTLGSAAGALCRSLDDPKDESFKFCKKVLLVCSRHSDPKPNPERDATYKSPAWSPTPRTEAAEALPWIGLRDTGKDVLDAIQALVNDPVPSVRYLIMRELFRISKSAEDLFWSLVDHSADHETNAVVEQALLATLSRVVSREEVRATQALRRLYARGIKINPGSEVLESFCDIIMWLLLVRENRWAQELSDDWLNKPRENHAILRDAAFDALSYLRPQALRLQERTVVFDRALQWLEKAIRLSGQEMAKMRHETVTNVEEHQTIIRDLYAVTDETVTRLRFAVDDRRKQAKEQSEEPISDEEYRRFYLRTKTLLEQVLGMALDEKKGILLAPTAHHFMELLAVALDFDLEGVVGMASGVARASSPTGYNLDQLAVGEVVRLVERVLADFRDEVRERQAILKDLLDLLDVFAAAGWPEALKLIWKLDEIFRQS